MAEIDQYRCAVSERLAPRRNRAFRPFEVAENRNIPGRMHQAHGKRLYLTREAREIRFLADQRKRPPRDLRRIADVSVPAIKALPLPPPFPPPLAGEG